MKYLLCLILTLTVITSCSDDEMTSEMPSTEFNNLIVTTSVNTIRTDRATVAVSTNIPTPISAITKFLYREFGTESFLETTNTILANLEKGKRHEVKTRITINGVDYDSQLIPFTTLGIETNIQTVGNVEIANKRFSLTFIEEIQLEALAEPLVAYIKIAQDSILAENLRLEDNTFSFEIKEETQVFFENDMEYINHKAFSLGFFSGDYYRNIEPDFLPSVEYNGESTSSWSVTNKKPRLDSSVIFEKQICLDSNDRDGVIDIKGRFWGSQDGIIKDNSNNIPDAIMVRLTNIDNPSIEKVYETEDLEDIFEIYKRCDIEAFGLIRAPINGRVGFHYNNFLRLRFNKDVIIPGNYNVTFVVEKDNVVYISDALSVLID